MNNLRTAMLKYYNAQLLELDRKMSIAERMYMYSIKRHSTRSDDVAFFRLLAQYERASEGFKQAKKNLFM